MVEKNHKVKKYLSGLIIIGLPVLIGCLFMLFSSFFQNGVSFTLYDIPFLAISLLIGFYLSYISGGTGSLNTFHYMRDKKDIDLNYNLTQKYKSKLISKIFLCIEFFIFSVLIVTHLNLNSKLNLENLILVDLFFPLVISFGIGVGITNLSSWWNIRNAIKNKTLSI